MIRRTDSTDRQASKATTALSRSRRIGLRAAFLHPVLVGILGINLWVLMLVAPGWGRQQAWNWMQLLVVAVPLLALAHGIVRSSSLILLTVFPLLLAGAALSTESLPTNILWPWPQTAMTGIALAVFLLTAASPAPQQPLTTKRSNQQPPDPSDRYLLDGLALVCLAMPAALIWHIHSGLHASIVTHFAGKAPDVLVLFDVLLLGLWSLVYLLMVARPVAQAVPRFSVVRSHGVLRTGLVVRIVEALAASLIALAAWWL
ncbi:MAG: hypothetical protein J7M25_01155 [Deltaproteobacteria bacterium]|nr:hypothetical protein [Deltaproteobacteria bacterium]